MSVVFSHDSRQLASASGDHAVKIWDAVTGECLQTLQGHGDSVESVVFSHDSRQLASASYDCIVKIWDAVTGKCLQTLEGHGHWVRSVVFSHDSRVGVEYPFAAIIRLFLSPHVEFDATTFALGDTVREVYSPTQPLVDDQGTPNISLLLLIHKLFQVVLQTIAQCSGFATPIQATIWGMSRISSEEAFQPGPRVTTKDVSLLEGDWIGIYHHQWMFDDEAFRGGDEVRSGPAWKYNIGWPQRLTIRFPKDRLGRYLTKETTDDGNVRISITGDGILGDLNADGFNGDRFTFEESLQSVYLPGSSSGLDDGHWYWRVTFIKTYKTGQWTRWISDGIYIPGKAFLPSLRWFLIRRYRDSRT
jgi:hypothetical protein